MPAAARPSTVSGSLAGRLRPLDDKPVGSLVVHEIYRSLQGESTHAGLPCTFIRLTACHLRCSYCDTAHAFRSGETLPLVEVVSRALATGDRLVELTGGEPLLQAEALPLMTALADAGRMVLLETSGAISTEGVDPRVAIILDVKTPGSGEMDANLDANLARLKPIDEVKYVVNGRDDFDWAVAHAVEHDLLPRVAVLFGAVHGMVAPEELAAWILETGLPFRLQVQLHKVLWGPKTRGV
jgi:7-carboxy-7-deazaguanine synthase